MEKSVNIVPVDYPAPAYCVGDNFAARHYVWLARGWSFLRCGRASGRIRPLLRTVTNELLEKLPSRLSVHSLEKAPTWHR